MKKRIFILFIAAILAFGLFGCGGSDDSGTEPEGIQYPSNPDFNNLQTRDTPYQQWREFGAHDPSIIKDGGKYYVFSTDVEGTDFGLQIRESDDLIHWQYYGTAFENNKTSNFKAGTADTQAAYNHTGVETLWAPDVVKGPDGKYWLYYSCSKIYTSISYIGLAKSDTVTGPYTHVAEILKSTTNSTPNTIDPQIIYEEDNTAKDMYMAYGSFGKHGIHIIKLDKNTGLPAPDDAQPERGTEHTYGYSVKYGKQLARDGMEGPVIQYLTVKENGVSKNYYYLFTSYDDLTSSYEMRCFRSQNLTGPYVDAAGNAIAGNGAHLDKGNKVMGSYQFVEEGKTSKVITDYYAPGHNDLFKDDNGKLFVVYHSRSTVMGNNQHYLFINQLAVNEDGWIVIAPNRYAGEKIQKIKTEEAAGKYKIIIMQQSGKVTKKYTQAELLEDGTVSGGYTGTWSMSGDNYINITLDADSSNGLTGRNIFKGVVLPQYLQDSYKTGLSITTLNQKGEAMFANAVISK